MYHKQYPPCMCQTPMANVPMANIPMENIPLNNIPMPGIYPEDALMDMDEKQLEMLYPRIYHKVRPMVQYQCDMLESKYGMMYIPTKDQVDVICDDIYKKAEKDIEEDDDYMDKSRSEYPEDEEDTRRRRYGRRRLFRDVIGIALIDELLGRRRRRRRPYYGVGYPYWY